MCPVPPETLVDVKFLAGTEKRHLASDWYWGTDISPKARIIAYRLTEEPPLAATTTI